MPRTDTIYRNHNFNNSNKPKDDLLFCIFAILAIAGMIWFGWASPEAQESIKKEEMQRAENCLAQYVRGGYGGRWDECKETKHLWYEGGIYEPVGTYTEGKKGLSVVSSTPRQSKGTRDFNNHCLIKSGNCSSKHTWLWSGGQIYEKMGAYSESGENYKITKWNPITDEEKANGAQIEQDKDFSNGNFFDPTTMPKNEDQSWFFN